MPKKERSEIQIKLEEMHKDLKEIREKDLPELKIEVAVVKERASTHAKVISAIGGILAVATSAAIAFLR
jgi:hypothetical protein